MSQPLADKTMPTLWLVIGSLLTYAVWPGLAMLAGYRFFDHWWEGAFMFGGVTGFCLLPPAIVFQFSDTTSAVLMIVLWALMWLAAVWLFARRPRNLQYQLLFILLVSVASFAQSALGLLMVLTKNV